MIDHLKKINENPCISSTEEKPLYSYVGCCPQFGQYINLYASDLATAEVGDSWFCEDQDNYPNGSSYWTVEVVVIYADSDGVLLKENNDGEVKLHWIRLHQSEEVTP